MHIGIMIIMYVLSYQLKLIKMHAKLANLNHYAVPFLSRAGVNLCWYYYIYIYNFDQYFNFFHTTFTFTITEAESPIACLNEEELSLYQNTSNAVFSEYKAL